MSTSPLPARRYGGLATAVRLLEWLAAASLFMMMLLAVVDVFGRYLFNRPVWGSVELTEFLMIGLIYAGLPLVTLRDEHVAFDLLDRFLPLPARRVQVFAGQALSFAITAVLAWLLWKRGIQLEAARDVTQTVKAPLFPFAYAMSVLMGITSLVHFGRLFFARTPGESAAL